MADDSAPSAAPGAPHHPVGHRAAGGRTLPVAGHGPRQRAHGPAGAARPRPARSVRQAVPDTPPAPTAVLAAGYTAPLALAWSAADPS